MLSRILVRPPRIPEVPALNAILKSAQRYRSVIAFAAWSNVAHGAVMVVVSIHLANARRELLIAGAFFGIIGAVVIALAPA
jgi:hypothetical protein